jgi:hypothetical protein
MHAPAHTLNDSPHGAPQGLPRRCLGQVQGLARACLGLAQGLPGPHPNQRRFAPLSTILANYGRIASISANERPSMAIHDSHPPLVNGDNGNCLPSTSQQPENTPLPNGHNGNRPPRTRSGDLAYTGSTKTDPISPLARPAERVP